MAAAATLQRCFSTTSTESFCSPSPTVRQTTFSPPSLLYAPPSHAEYNRLSCLAVITTRRPTPSHSLSICSSLATTNLQSKERNMFIEQNEETEKNRRATTTCRAQRTEAKSIKKSLIEEAKRGDEEESKSDRKNMRIATVEETTTENKWLAVMVMVMR
ncbi:unnamed protein product [Linum trigynum]|uniref:Uncharacterized protein n=1 Tax=Linum trigynum TaxID=586398 RepID=A0AAV2CT99_9ROSI